MDRYYWTLTGQGTYAQCMANCGAFVAFSGYRFDAGRSNLEVETNYMTAIYNQMVANPNIDRNRIFLFAPSSASLVIDDLVEQYPTRWRGIMLASPGVLLNPQVGITASVLLTAGASENKLERFREEQAELCKVGIPVKWYLHPDEGHIERAQNTMYKKSLLMEDLVFEH
jgi:predicted esterase